MNWTPFPLSRTKWIALNRVNSQNMSVLYCICTVVSQILYTFTIPSIKIIILYSLELLNIVAERLLHLINTSRNRRKKEIPKSSYSRLRKKVCKNSWVCVLLLKRPIFVFWFKRAMNNNPPLRIRDLPPAIPSAGQCVTIWSGLKSEKNI